MPKNRKLDDTKGTGFAMEDEDYAAAAEACAHIQANFPNEGSGGVDLGIDVDDPDLEDIEFEEDDDDYAAKDIENIID